MSEFYMEEIKYVREEQIGQGAFGTVHKVIDRNTSRRYAVKDIICKNNTEIQNGLAEIRALGRGRHDNVVALLNVTATQCRPFEATLSLLTEYCAKGNLNERLRSKSSVALDYQWMDEILDAMEYLYSQNIIHRDLKPQNVLLTVDEHIKLADFGLAARFCQKEENQTWLTYYLSQGVGAACYVAPELVKEPIKYNYKVDVFAAGVMFYAILERQYMVVQNERCYGLYITDADGIKKPLGIHLYNMKNDAEIPFTHSARIINRSIEEMVKYDYHERPDFASLKLRAKTWQKKSQCIIL